MKILMLSHTADTGTFKVGSHHLARELARQGHAVVHVSTPVSLLHLLKLRDRDVRKRFALALRRRADEEGVVHVVPLTLVPAGMARRLSRLVLNPARRAVRSSLRGGPDAVLVDQVHLWRYFRNFTPSVLVYRPTDVHFDDTTRREEARILEAADGVVATSRVVLDAVVGLTARSLPALVLENGVELDVIQRANSTPWSERSGFVYVGALDARFDWEVVRELAALFPDETIRLAGPTTMQPGDLPRNVELLGPIAYREVASLLSAGRVGLLPLSDHPGNAGRSPMKYYEYLAAGLWVLASSSPSLRERGAPGVRLFERGPDLQVQAARVVRWSVAAANVEGEMAARSFSWQHRGKMLEDFLAALRGA